MARTSEIRHWLTQKLIPDASEDALPPDYVAIKAQDKGTNGRRGAYSQAGRVRVRDRAPAVVADEVAASIEETARSREADGEPLVRVKVQIWTVKGAECLGEHVFVVGDAAEDAASGAAEAGTREGELVAALRELRLTVADQSQALRVVTAGGMQLAIETVRELSAARAELADARGALIVAEGDKQDSFSKLVDSAAPAIPLILAQVAERAMREKAGG